MVCRVTALKNFLRLDRQRCADELCNSGSEMQREFREGAASTPLAVVADEIAPVAWAAKHEWRGYQTLEGFTDPRYRRRGLQRWAASGLIVAGHLDIARPVAVFAPACVELTRSLGFVESVLFERSGGDWVRVS